MSGKLVVHIPSLPMAQRERISAAAAAKGLVLCFADDMQDALREAADAEILFTQAAGLAKAAPRLKWLCTPSAGVNNFTGPEVFASPEAALSNSSGAYGTTIAEHIVMVTLNMMRRLPEYDEIVARREWTRNLPIRSIRDCRVTLLGTGDIGQEAALRLRAFSPACLIGVNRRGRNPGDMFDRVVPLAELDGILPETDLLILSLPGTAETEHLMDERRLRLLPRDAYLVNVGRGTVVDQKALEALLRAGHLAGAALDVFEQEPLPQADSMWECPRTLITPHVAGNMTLPYTVEKITSLFLEDLDRYCAGEPLRRLVDRSQGY